MYGFGYHVSHISCQKADKTTFGIMLSACHCRDYTALSCSSFMTCMLTFPPFVLFYTLLSLLTWHFSRKEDETIICVVTRSPTISQSPNGEFYGTHWISKSRVCGKILVTYI